MIETPLWTASRRSWLWQESAPPKDTFLLIRGVLRPPR